MAAQNQEIVAQFDHEVTSFDNGEAGRTVIGIAYLNGDAKDEITLKGIANERELRDGMEYRFYGHWTTHWKHGKQFHFSSFVSQQPLTPEGIIAYLQQCDGIGESTAWAIYNEFGGNAVATLRENPQLVAGSVKRFSLERATTASELLKQKHSVELVTIDLMGLLKGRRFPKNTVKEAIKKWGSQAPSIVRRDPHYLMNFRGCGFLNTDKMYLEVGKNPARLKRQALCAWYSIAKNTDGSTWFPIGQIQSAVRESIAGTQSRPDDAIELGLRSKMLDQRESGGQLWIAEWRKSESERIVAEAVIEAATEPIEWPDIELIGGGLSDHQRDELAKALRGNIGILGGSPGTGKTFTAGALLRLLCELYGEDHIAAAAPTGKAAVRLTQSLNANGLQLSATTIHRLLEVNSNGDDGWGFNYNAGNKLPFKVLLFDEMSMTDTSLMASLLSARAAGTLTIFLGDTNQLAPVGHGAPLRDLIAAGVPHGELKEIRRNSGAIVELCAEIRDHGRFKPPIRFDFENGGNLAIFARKESVEQRDAMFSYLKHLHSQGVDPVWDCQILVPKNKDGVLSRKELNKELRKALNPHGTSAGNNPFCVGDKVINLKNGWFPVWKDRVKDSRIRVRSAWSGDSDDADDQPEKVFVANGELGAVIDVEPARSFIKLSDPDRYIILPHGQKGDDETNDDPQQDDAGSAGSWDLGYAITAHKSQGSEWPHVVVMLDESARRMLTRNWIYTAISRAKTACLLIGLPWVADAACRVSGLNRKTLLAERILDMRPEPEPLNESEIDSLFAGVV